LSSFTQKLDDERKKTGVSPLARLVLHPCSQMSTQPSSVISISGEDAGDAVELDHSQNSIVQNASDPPSGSFSNTWFLFFTVLGCAVGTQRISLFSIAADFDSSKKKHHLDSNQLFRFTKPSPNTKL
jgi:hypothetical protein